MQLVKPTESKPACHALQARRSADELAAELDSLYEAAPIGMCLVDRDLRFVRINGRLAAIYGRPVAEHIGRTIREVLPQVASEVETHYRHVIESGRPMLDVEVRGQAACGPQAETCWKASYYPIMASNGEVEGVTTVVEDVTGHRRAKDALRAREEALSKRRKDFRVLAGKLLKAQEAERRRIARELHDDVTQRLASLAIEIAEVERRLDTSPDWLRRRLGEMRSKIVRVSSDVHSLSHLLHCSILDDLGLVRAIRSECRRFSQCETVEVEFTHDDLSDRLEVLPRDLALCLYRIAQECLRNIAKHARATQARVSLTLQSEEARLAVEDNGIGFRPEAVRNGAGLGLASMEQRARLCGGRLFVESTPGHGTTIRARVAYKGSSR